MTNVRTGLTARIGIIIIAVVVALVGVVVYFVYQKTTVHPNQAFSIRIGTNPIILEKGATITVPVELKTANMSDPISFTVNASAELTATVSSTTINPTGSTSLVITGNTQTESGNVTVKATQGSQSAEISSAVKVIIASTNTNTAANTNSQTNKNTNTRTNVNTNTNTSTGLVRSVNKDFKFSFSYPASWGDPVKPALVHLVPTQGYFFYYYFSLLGRSDLPGNLVMTAASANYAPTDSVGTPRWFATTFTPQGTEDQIAKEVVQAGFKAFDITKVTIDGKPGIRMLYLRGYYNNFLDVAYVIYDGALGQTPNIFLSRSIDYIKSATDFSDATDADILAVIAKLKAGTLSEQSMRNFNEFEAMVKTIQFTQ